MSFLDACLNLTNLTVRPLWITESGSVSDGAKGDLSRGFVAALRYADKLALAATLGVSLMTRQSLFEGRDSLFNISDGYSECPDYWISYLFKVLNGKVPLLESD